MTELSMDFFAAPNQIRLYKLREKHSKAVMQKGWAMTAKKARYQQNATAAAAADHNGDDSETLTASWHVAARIQCLMLRYFPQNLL